VQKSHINNIFEKMCKIINIDNNSIDFTKNNWYKTKLWSDNQRTEFKLWLTEHIKDNNVSRELCEDYNMSQEKRELASEWFLFNYGWTVKGVGNTLGSYKKKAWLYAFYESSITADKAKDIYPIVKNIKSLFAEKEYQIVDEILNEIQIGQLSATAMVAFISSSFPARRNLSNWNSTCDEVKNKLEEMGLDSKSILIGFLI
jgi:hypothetical protein